MRLITIFFFSDMELRVLVMNVTVHDVKVLEMFVSSDDAVFVHSNHVLLTLPKLKLAILGHQVS